MRLGHWQRMAMVVASSFMMAVAALAQTSEPNPAVQAALATARQQMAEHKFRDAEKSLKSALKASGDNCRQCSMALASTYWNLGDSKAAFQSLDRALAISRTSQEKAEVHTIKGNFMLGFRDKAKLKDADSEYHAALALDPNYATAHYGLGVTEMRGSHDEEGKNELNAYLQIEPKGLEAENARLMISNPRRARERYAPEFSAKDLHGEKVSLKDYAGKIVVLDFWATWCGPCRASVGDLKDLVKKYPADKLVLISISADKSEAPWREFIRAKQMDWTHVFDRDGQIAEDFNVHAFPTYMLIDGEGIIRDQVVGEDDRQSVVYRLKDKLKTMPELKSN
jgi:peroxiredoxin/Tfp pilus assembly protein PilF